jgi:hypothetical protein
MINVNGCAAAGYQIEKMNKLVRPAVLFFVRAGNKNYTPVPGHTRHWH